jgi:DNA repair protein RadA/Sms
VDGRLFRYARGVSKPKSFYICDSCGAGQPKWQGQCPDCGGWNTFKEARSPIASAAHAARAEAVRAVRLDRLDVAGAARIESGLGELDRVLGGGFVPGSVVLIGGDPGIGKSTLLLSALATIARRASACYVTGEESLQQVGLRAERLGMRDAPVDLIAETGVEAIVASLEARPPAVLVIDSIQTLSSGGLESAPGSVSQLRECAAQLVRFAKATDTATVLVGHVTKEGTLAGPRLLEHMVDTVLYFENDAGSRFRIIRAAKNRFGAANEMGFFVMADDGFKEVRNPSAIFLARRTEPVPGTVTLVTRESTRSLLVEVQALVDCNNADYPRRLAQGFDVQRLGLLLAVLHRHCGVELAGADVFANVVGGLRISETASDLAVALAVLSSFRAAPVPGDTVLFGEIGLTGEVRPVPFGEERLAEAHKHGFRRVLLPHANRPRRAPEGMEVIALERLRDALAPVFG